MVLSCASRLRKCVASYSPVCPRWKRRASVSAPVPATSSGVNGEIVSNWAGFVRFSYHLMALSYILYVTRSLWNMIIDIGTKKITEIRRLIETSPSCYWESERLFEMTCWGRPHWTLTVPTTLRHLIWSLFWTGALEFCASLFSHYCNFP